MLGRSDIKILDASYYDKIAWIVFCGKCGQILGVIPGK